MTIPEPENRLTAARIEQIRQAYRDGMTIMEMHHFFGISPDHLIDIVRHHPWKPEQQSNPNDPNGEQP